MNNKNPVIFSINVEKAFDKIQPPFLIKTLNKIGIEETYLNVIKAIYSKPTANITPKSENIISSKIKNKTKMLIGTTLILGLPFWDGSPAPDLPSILILDQTLTAS